MGGPGITTSEVLLNDENSDNILLVVEDGSSKFTNHSQ